MLFPSRKRARKSLSCYRPRLESLENRVVLNAGFTPLDSSALLFPDRIADTSETSELLFEPPQISYDALTRVVHIEGTPFDDTVEVNIRHRAGTLIEESEDSVEVRIDSPTGSVTQSFDITFESWDGTPSGPHLVSPVVEIEFLGFAGADTFRNLTGIASYVEGGQGCDTLHGGQGSDTLLGGADSDHLYGGPGEDYLDGGSEADYLYGQAGVDTVLGGPGRDWLYWDPGDGNDVMDGGGGYDRVEVDGSSSARDIFDIGANVTDSSRLSVSTMAPEVISLDIGTVERLNINSQGNNDTFTIHSLNTVTDLARVYLHGGSGNDTFNLLAGLDVPQLRIYGDSGAKDWLRYNTWSTGVEVDLGSGTATGTRYVTGIECVRGGRGPDILRGHQGIVSDTLFGGPGNDELHGRAGEDTLLGGGGDDKLFGGDGIDTLRGGTENDYLDGGAEEDRLYGDSGDDGLYGGTGYDRLYGDIGNDRFLEGPDDSDVIIDLDVFDDVRVQFRNNPALHDKKFDGRNEDSRWDFAAGAWTAADIALVDAALANVQQATGNTRLLKRPNDPMGQNPLVYCMSGAATQVAGAQDTGISGWNEGGNVTFVVNASKRTVYHEIGHNWDTAEELGSERYHDWLDLSGWVSTRSNPGSQYTATSPNDDHWYMLNTAGFASWYARYNPQEDMAETFEAYFSRHDNEAELGDGTSAGVLGTADINLIPTKKQFLDDLFASMSLPTITDFFLP